MTKARRKIDAALKAKIALEALREQTTGNELSQRHQVHPNQICAGKNQLQENAVRAVDAKVGAKAEAANAREIEKLHAKACPRARAEDRAVDFSRTILGSGPRTTFFAKRFGR